MGERGRETFSPHTCMQDLSYHMEMAHGPNVPGDRTNTWHKGAHIVGSPKKARHTHSPFRYDFVSKLSWMMYACMHGRTVWLVYVVVTAFVVHCCLYPVPASLLDCMHSLYGTVARYLSMWHLWNVLMWIVVFCFSWPLDRRKYSCRKAI
jgi:hypothetical protein